MMVKHKISVYSRKCMSAEVVVSIPTRDLKYVNLKLKDFSKQIGWGFFVQDAPDNRTLVSISPKKQQVTPSEVHKVLPQINEFNRDFTIIDINEEDKIPQLEVSHSPSAVFFTISINDAIELDEKCPQSFKEIFGLTLKEKLKSIKESIISKHSSKEEKKENMRILTQLMNAGINVKREL